MSIVFTKHADKKFEDLNLLGIKVTKKLIIDVVSYPEDIDNQSDYPKLIASKSMNTKIVMRVVYRFEENDIIIITFYPAKKGRYYK